MNGRSRAIYREGPTHDDGRIRRVGQPGNISGFRYDVNPTELHVDPGIDVLESAVYSAISVSRCLLERNIGEVLWPCIEALACFHALGGNTRLRKKSVCTGGRCHRRISITETSPKLKEQNQARLMRTL
jgi:hypothetical protein